MRRLTVDGEAAVNDIARRHGFTADAVSSMLDSILAGHGGMAQFSHAEFGGSGQWMRGGMLMISDMFNTTLKSRVQRLCDELAQLVADQTASEQPEPQSPNRSAAGERPKFFAAMAGFARDDWWPADLGRPSSAGAQNDMRYAYFAAARRLAIAAGDRVTVYDTLDHRIAGVAQAQSGRGSLTLSSQHGVVNVATLPVVSGPRESVSAQGGPAAGGPQPASAPGEARAASDDVFATIEKLAELHRKGIVSEPEFAAKKAELLSRL